MKVALYARVSGHEQKKEETVETQRFYLEKWARDSGHEVVGWYADENVRSVVPLRDREEGGRLLRDAAKGQFNAVVIYRLGRWSRYTQVWHDGKEALDGVGVDLISLNDDLRDDTPGDRFSLGVKLLVNELDRDTIAQNCLDGKYRRAHEGGYTGGIVPYGYRVAGTRGRWLELDPAETEIVVSIYRWLVEERLTCVQIARRLNATHVPTACQSTDETRHRKHCKDARGLWTNTRVSRMVRNSAYYGEKEFGASNGGKRERVMQKFPPVVDREMWLRAQQRIEENRLMSRRNAKHDYLLRGLVVCAHCKRRCYGKTMNSHTGRPITYYVCNRKTLKYQGYEPDLPHCPLCYVRADSLETDLWENLYPHIKNHRETVELLRYQATEGEEIGRALQSTLDALRAALTRNQTARRRAVALATDDLITRDELAEQTGRLRKEATDLDEQVAALEARLAAEKTRDRLLDEAGAWLRQWDARLNGDITLELQRDAVRHFVVKIELHVTEDDVKPLYFFVYDPRIRSCNPNVTALGSQLLCLVVPGSIVGRAA